ncbi:MAG: hypothetical protein HRU11_00010 [Parvularculaceae bacterium]|nr:hypothetical protein [Parvularculaceae bacterium]
MPHYPPDLFPATRAHEGVWQGTYTHLNAAAEIEDQHASTVFCEFPDDDGKVFYRQRIHFSWQDGRDRHDVFEGIPKDGALWYDTPTFHGKSWEAGDGVILLNLQRKDEPGAHFFEIIAMGTNGHRARTWHWFREGQLYRRTLCDERRVD